MDTPLTRPQLHDLGWTHATIARAEATGELLRLRRGAWLLDRPDGARDFHIASAEAARQAAGEGAVLSHWSAAALWGLPLPEPGPGTATITRPGSSGGRRKPEAHLVKAPLRDDEVCQHQGIWVTDLHRTVNDIARSAPFIDGVMVADAALRRGVRRSGLYEAHRRARRWPGNAKAGRVIYVADGRAESPQESRCRARLLEMGLDDFHPQFIIHGRADMEVARVDLGSDRRRLALEYDGEQKYLELAPPGQTPVEVFRREKERDCSDPRRGMVGRTPWKGGRAGSGALSPGRQPRALRGDAPPRRLSGLGCRMDPQDAHVATACSRPSAQEVRWDDEL